MGNLVVNGAAIQCTFGAAPATLIVLPATTLAVSQPAGIIMSNAPGANIPPFGVCNSIANPTVASATAAASGVLTPMPCVPVIAAPWAPGSPTVMIGGQPALNDASKAACNWGGVISINFAGQATVQVP